MPETGDDNQQACIYESGETLAHGKGTVSHRDSLLLPTQIESTMRLNPLIVLVEGPPGDAPWSIDYTQRISARSILLDEADGGLVGISLEPRQVILLDQIKGRIGAQESFELDLINS